MKTATTSSLYSGLAELAWRRRATPHFRSDPVPEEVISQALALAAQAPSGYNFQPWRFLVLRDAQQRARLRAAAFDQSKITEAPVVIVAFAGRETWKDTMDEILRVRAEKLDQSSEKIPAQKKAALAFLDGRSRSVWLNRQVMIAFTHLMLAVEALGWDTAPMEGFDAAHVRENLALPDDSEVIALLAIGRAEEETPHPGRLRVERIAFDDHYGNPWPVSVEEENLYHA